MHTPGSCVVSGGGGGVSGVLASADIHLLDAPCVKGGTPLIQFRDSKTNEEIRVRFMLDLTNECFQTPPRCVMQDDHAVYKIIIGFLRVWNHNTLFRGISV